MGMDWSHLRTIWKGSWRRRRLIRHWKEISVLFGDNPPHPLVYEWISLKGQGAMSSSTGNTIGPLEALELVPPEILRYLIASTKSQKSDYIRCRNVVS